jgi:hypothetical protein
MSRGQTEYPEVRPYIKQQSPIATMGHKISKFLDLFGIRDLSVISGPERVRMA